MEKIGSFSSSNSNHRPDSSRSTEDSRIVAEKSFQTVLVNATREGVKDALGAHVLEILVTRGLLDSVESPKEFERQLATLFGNGARILERLVVKELYRDLGIPFNSASAFDYANSLEVAKEFCYSRAKLK